ncbi:flagella assembly protein FlgT [Candidatus Photodesmus anomalopis]|uniref:flagella assembly protein FlgT n=1 Tax=Candidatus Photodesmus anomalopis TaxID=28176 RepID=UPI000551E0F5
MHKYVPQFFLVLYLVFYTAHSFAVWYEVTGTSRILSSERIARARALEDALFKAVSFSGKNIGTINSLIPFLKEHKTKYHFENHLVRHMLIEKQEIENNIFFVKAKIQILQSRKICDNQYKKTFLVSNINLAYPEQAVLGQIYNIGEDFSRIISRQLNQESRSFISVGTTNYEIDKAYPERLIMIAKDAQAQFIITGTITDLTITSDEKKNQNKNSTVRQFAIEIQVFDGKTGQKIYDQNYREVAKWSFAKVTQVNTKSANFWLSDYGEMILQVNRRIMLDLESQMSCKITLPEIISKLENIVTMNLGRLHGVKKGDKLQLWHMNSFTDSQGFLRKRINQSDITLTVSRVYENQSELKINEVELGKSIQIGDFVQKLPS